MCCHPTNEFPVGSGGVSPVQAFLIARNILRAADTEPACSSLDPTYASHTPPARARATFLHLTPT